jgi:hypothetical protein
MKTIPLTQGYEAIVDDEDYDSLMQHKWHILKVKDLRYARRKSVPTYADVLMHRQIMGVTDRSLDVDHKNGNGLDNRRENLQVIGHDLNVNLGWRRKGKGRG